MDKDSIMGLLQQIVIDRGVPRNVKTSIEESIKLLESGCPESEKYSSLISLLDDASNDPNISIPARTNIWNLVSILEDAVSGKSRI